MRERAYALWERDGRPEGRSDEYWQMARSEVEAEDAEPGNERSDDATEKRHPRRPLLKGPAEAAISLSIGLRASELDVACV